MAQLFETPKHADLIYDVGMHQGEDAEFYLRKGFRVVAFEADPELLRSCEQRLKDYILRGQLTIIAGAIVDPEIIAAGATKVVFYRNTENTVWGTVHADWAARNARLGTPSLQVEVNAVNFAEILRAHGIPHYLKIDIEGCDLICVNALKKFRARPDYLSLESDKTSLANIAREIAALADLGYDAFQAIEQSTLPANQTPPDPPAEGNYVAHCFKSGDSGLFGAELNSEWKTASEVLNQYRAIRLGYYLLGDDGVMNQWKFRGAPRLRRRTANVLRRFTKAIVPGWYDTHARHSSCITENPRP